MIDQRETATGNGDAVAGRAVGSVCRHGQDVVDRITISDASMVWKRLDLLSELLKAAPGAMVSRDRLP